MNDKHLPWENPEQDYKKTLAKRRSERRYRSIQLAKTLRVSLTRFKNLSVAEFNSEILNWIDVLEKDAEYLEDTEFAEAKKFVTKMKRQLTNLEKK